MNSRARISDQASNGQAAAPEESGPSGLPPEEPRPPGPARTWLSRRRVLLAAGGAVLLAACAPADSAGHAPAPAGFAAGHPAGPPPARAEPGPEPGSPARQPRLPGGGTEAGSLTPPAAGTSAGTGPGPAAYEHLLFSLQDGPHVIALTIDDGPSPVYTPQVLRLLARYRVTATFSMVGIHVQAYPGVVRDVAAAGHVIANHTWTHPDLAALAPGAVRDEMIRTTGLIHQVTGHTPGLFRAPYGAWSPAVLQQCAQQRLVPLDWSVDPRDWSRPGTSAIVANIMASTRTGSIILEHDGGGDRSETVAALTIVLPRLLAAGYRFTTP